MAVQRKAPARVREAPAPARAQVVAAPARRRTVAVDEKIYRSVLNAVMNRRLPPGARLAEAELCEVFSVSRTIVRKALQRLAHDHIVELRPNRGAIVAAPTPEAAREIFAARRVIERDIVAMVARNLPPQGLGRLREVLAAEHRAMHSGDRTNWIRLGGEFHILLAEMAGNRVLMRFLVELVSRCSLIIALYENPGSPMCENDEHARLVTLIEKGRVAEAVDLMDHHVGQIEARLNLGETVARIRLADALAER